MFLFILLRVPNVASQAREKTASAAINSRQTQAVGKLRLLRSCLDRQKNSVPATLLHVSPLRDERFTGCAVEHVRAFALANVLGSLVRCVLDVTWHASSPRWSWYASTRAATDVNLRRSGPSFGMWNISEVQCMYSRRRKSCPRDTFVRATAELGRLYASPASERYSAAESPAGPTSGGQSGVVCRWWGMLSVSARAGPARPAASPPARRSSVPFWWLRRLGHFRVMCLPLKLWVKVKFSVQSLLPALKHILWVVFEFLWGCPVLGGGAAGQKTMHSSQARLARRSSLEGSQSFASRADNGQALNSIPTGTVTGHVSTLESFFC